MSSSCVGEMMSSKFRVCDFCLEESQVLNCKSHQINPRFRKAKV
ncbi:hypothetical protein HanHA300_Chr09g0303731 [Helianthus annuus]|nr:hypothetical protein HanHA300_Chr09g0303731 [Helianthus annuus]KAJ0541019.1 hypothetical protein HanHA89_Chr09g0323721 [Helianthus annuus]KAJ0706102.1 hypothetical protein HanLR1_Chr09g0303221 [Helianthus annuus]